MSKYLFYIFLVIILFPAALSSQSFTEGTYVYKPLEKFNWAQGRGEAILSFSGNRFNLYSFPLDIVGSITLRTGTYSYSDTTVQLDVDTSYRISLNILRLTSLNINCDPSYNGIHNSKTETISLKKVIIQDLYQLDLDSTLSQENKVQSMEFEFTMDNTVAIALRRYGVTLDWFKECLRQKPLGGLKVCYD